MKQVVGLVDKVALSKGDKSTQVLSAKKGSKHNVKKVNEIDELEQQMKRLFSD